MSLCFRNPSLSKSISRHYVFRGKLAAFFNLATPDADSFLSRRWNFRSDDGLSDVKFVEDADPDLQSADDVLPPIEKPPSPPSKRSSRISKPSKPIPTEDIVADEIKRIKEAIKARKAREAARIRVEEQVRLGMDFRRQNDYVFRIIQAAQILGERTKRRKEEAVRRDSKLVEIVEVAAEEHRRKTVDELWMEEAVARQDEWRHEVEKEQSPRQWDDDYLDELTRNLDDDDGGEYLPCGYINRYPGADRLYCSSVASSHTAESLHPAFPAPPEESPYSREHVHREGDSDHSGK